MHRRIYYINLFRFIKIDIFLVIRKLAMNKWSNAYNSFLEKLSIIVFFSTSFHLVSIVLIFLLIYFLWKDYYFLFILYGVYYIIDFKRFDYGGYDCSFMTNGPLKLPFAKYFPISLTKTVDLTPDRNYIFACAPHSVIPFGPLNFMSDVNKFPTLFPGLKTHLLTLKRFFYIPITREYMFLHRACAASMNSLKYILGNQGVWKEKGQVCVLMVGGAQEMMYSLPGEIYFLILKNRKGFIRAALETGASIVPVFSFGENNLYATKTTNPCSWYGKFQVFFKKLTSMGLPYGHGCGLFSQKSKGVFPFRNPIHTVVGEPIHVIKTNNPSQEQVDELHQRYSNDLFQLFETHKVRFENEKNKKIVLLD